MNTLTDDLVLFPGVSSFLLPRVERVINLGGGGCSGPCNVLVHVVLSLHRRNYLFEAKFDHRGCTGLHDSIPWLCRGDI
jgi:hypothetical protein